MQGDASIGYPEELPLSSEKSMEEVLGEDMYPYIILQLGSAYAGMMVSQHGSVGMLLIINRHKQ